MSENALPKYLPIERTPLSEKPARDTGAPALVTAAARLWAEKCRKNGPERSLPRLEEGRT